MKVLPSPRGRYAGAAGCKKWNVFLPKGHPCVAKIKRRTHAAGQAYTDRGDVCRRFCRAEDGALRGQYTEREEERGVWYCPPRKKPPATEQSVAGGFSDAE